MNLTIGQQRVGVTFNPSNKDKVDEIKALSAQLIDLLEAIKSPDSCKETLRAISIAQTHVETASMYGVKSIFIKERQ